MQDKNKDKIKIRGTVSEVLRSGFTVLLENGLTVSANVSGKIRVHRIQILKGDIVEVELSPYDLTRGRIIYRIS